MLPIIPRVVALIAAALLVSLAVACAPSVPAPCVCEECPPCEAAAAAPAVTPPAPAVTPPTPAAPVRATRAGRVEATPGTGAEVEIKAPSRREMHTVFMGFLAAAGGQDLAEMRKWTTKRLGDTLERNMEKYSERLYRGLSETISAVPTGARLTETREMGSGNVEAMFKFGNDHERRVVFFQEDGKWRLNRL